MNKKEFILPAPNCQQSQLLLSRSTSIEHPELSPGALAAGDNFVASGGKCVSPPLRVANFGTDTINLSFHVSFSNPGEIFSGLAEKKAYLQSGSEKEVNYQFSKSELFSFNLQKTGTPVYAYRLCTGDITLLLSPRSHTGNTPNVGLEIGSMSSQQGLVETVNQFKLWILHLGGVIVQEKLSRIDVAADIPIPISETGIDDKERHICRASDCAVYNSDRKLTGVHIGKGSISVRVYDKLKEMEVKKAHVKQTFFKMLWGGNQTDMTRVEFQLRRERILEMFPDDSRLSTVLPKLPEMWTYFTENWFRQVDGVVDRENKHQSRCEVSTFWKLVQAASGFQSVPIARNRKRIHINIPALKKMVAGCLLSITAGLGQIGDDIFGVIATSRGVIEEVLEELLVTPDFKKKYAIRQTAALITF